MINTGLTDKKQHLETPFTVDWPAGKDRFVHVFDELTVDMLLSGVDTVSDLVGYFSEKERFLSSAEYVPWPTARQPWHKDACNRHNQRGMEWVM